MTHINDVFFFLGGGENPKDNQGTRKEKKRK
jgi:hypothetical protein